MIALIGAAMAGPVAMNEELTELRVDGKAVPVPHWVTDATVTQVVRLADGTVYLHQANNFFEGTCRAYDPETSSFSKVSCAEPRSNGTFVKLEARGEWLLFVFGSEGHGYADFVHHPTRTSTTDPSKRLPIVLQRGPTAYLGVEGPLIAAGCQPQLDGGWLEANCDGTTQTWSWDGAKLQKVDRTKGFATPKDAVQAFVLAAMNEDVTTLRRCFSVKAPGEFASLRDGTTSAEKLKGLGQFVKPGTIGAVEVRGDEARVAVALSRPETITVVREGDTWRILDF